MEKTTKRTSLVLCGSILAGLGAVGCSDLPGDEKTQGAVIGGVAGAAGGALVAGDDDRLIGALIGGALGAGGGYLIGSSMEDDDHDDRDKAIESAQRAERNPATAAQARAARTADVNGDGYVTMDEVVAMRKAGYSDTEIISRLERTGMFFELTPQQRNYLRDNGVSQHVIDEMERLNPDARRRAAEKLGPTSYRDGDSYYDRH